MLILASILLFQTATLAQKKNTFTFNHLALSVKDLNIAAAFYKDVLHLKEIKNRTEKDGIRWFSLGEGKELHLVSTIKEPVTTNKAVHFALAATNFDGLIQAFTKAKIEYSDWPGEAQKITIRADGIKQIYLQDPDGYWIEINSLQK